MVYKDTWPRLLVKSFIIIKIDPVCRAKYYLHKSKLILVVKQQKKVTYPAGDMSCYQEIYDYRTVLNCFFNVWMFWSG